MINTYCPKCHSAAVIKSGFISGNQRFKCKACHYFFTHHQKGISADKKKLAFHLYLEGFSLRAISRIIGVSDVAVGKWINPVRQYLVPFRKRKVKTVELHRIEHFLMTRNMFQQFGWLLIGLEENNNICLLGTTEGGNCQIIEQP